jgi:hypothetical protein
MTIKPLVHRHAEDAAFYWSRFNEGSLLSGHDARTQARFETLLLGNLEGLRVAQLESGVTERSGTVSQLGLAGWDATWQRVQKWRTADEAFVCGVIALEDAHAPASTDLNPPRGANSLLLQLEAAASAQFNKTATLTNAGERSIAQGLTSAAVWLPWATVQGTVYAWARSPDPVLRRCAVAACALHRIAAGHALQAWLLDPHPLVRARALKAVGELGQTTLAPQLLEVLQETAGDRHAPDPHHCRYWAAWSLCLLGRSEGIEPLANFATVASAPHLLHSALAALGQVMPKAQLRDAITAALARSAGGESRTAALNLRIALTAIRYSGDLGWLGTLVKVMQHFTQEDALEAFFKDAQSNPARLAADVFAHLTGERISEQLWMAAPEEPDDGEGRTGREDDQYHDHGPTSQAPVGLAAHSPSNPNMPAERKQDPDDGMLWPDVQAVHARWTAHQTKLRDAAAQGDGNKVIAGKPLNAANAKSLLADVEATQLQRHHAALYLRCTQQSATLFDVRAPSPRQRLGVELATSQ